MRVFSTANCVSAAIKITGTFPSPFHTPQRKETLEKNFQLIYFHVVSWLCREPTAHGSWRSLLEEHMIKIWQKCRRTQLYIITVIKKNHKMLGSNVTCRFLVYHEKEFQIYMFIYSGLNSLRSALLL